MKKKKEITFTLSEMEKLVDMRFKDPTGAELAPGDPDNCQGNGEHPDFEICCDECDFFLKCFPEWEKGNPML